MSHISRHPILFSFLIVTLLSAILVSLFVFLLTSIKRPGTSLFSGGDIAVIKIEGPIFDSSEWMRDLDDYRRSKSVKAVVLRIDSPGGAVAPSQEIFEEVRKLKAKKKVIVSMGTTAASGAYYIASAADKIFAQPGTITGSIGVIMEGFDLQELARWAHLENRVLKSGHFKDAGSPFRDMTPEEKVYLQGLLDNMYGQFKKAVAESRGIPLDKMDELADGKIYTGEQALALKLVDAVGTLYDAIEEAKKMAGLSPDASVIWPREEKLPLEWLFDLMISRHSIRDLMEKYLGQSSTMPIGLYLLRI